MNTCATYIYIHHKCLSVTARKQASKHRRPTLDRQTDKSIRQIVPLPPNKKWKYSKRWWEREKEKELSTISNFTKLWTKNGTETKWKRHQKHVRQARSTQIKRQKYSEPTGGFNGLMEKTFIFYNFIYTKHRDRHKRSTMYGLFA